MEKYTDPWQGISRLIRMEKEQALAEFRSREFTVPAEPAVRPAAQKPRLLALHPAFLAVAASLLLAIGLALFLLLRGSWQTTPVDSGLLSLLADSFLYGHRREPQVRMPESGAVSSFFPLFLSWGETAGLNRTAAPDAKAAVSSLPIEHGDPADVQRRMKKVIRESVLERMLVQFGQIGKEV